MPYVVAVLSFGCLITAMHTVGPIGAYIIMGAFGLIAFYMLARVIWLSLP